MNWSASIHVWIHSNLNPIPDPLSGPEEFNVLFVSWGKTGCCYRLDCVLFPNSNTEVLTPVTSEYDLEVRSLQISLVKIGSLGWPLIQRDQCPCKKKMGGREGGRIWTQTHTHTYTQGAYHVKMKSDGSINEGAPKSASKPLDARRGRNRSLPQASEGNNLPPLWPQTSSLQNRSHKFLQFKPPRCGA